MKDSDKTKKQLTDNFNDITERKQAEEALKSSEERFRIIFESAPDAYYLIDKNGILSDANKAAEDMLGYKKEELLGKNLLKLKLLPTTQIVKATKLLAKSALGKGTGPDEFILFRKDDSIVTVEIRTFPVKINNKTVVLGIAREITERKKAEEELKESEEKYRILAENAQHLIITHDFEGKITYANAFAKQYIDLPEEQVIGLDIKQFVSDKKEIEEFQRRVKDFKTNKTAIHHYLLNIALPIGEQRVLEVYGNPIRQDGNNIAVLLIAYDITDRKQAEEKIIDQKEILGSIIEGTNVGTWAWNVQTGELNLNKKWAEIIGYTLDELSPLSTETWTKYAHPEDLKKSNELLEKHFKGEVGYYHFECRMKNKKDEWIWVLDRGKVISWTDDGKPLWMFGTHQDITERKRVQEKLKINEDRLTKVLLAANDGMWDWNLETNKVYFDPRYYRMAGYDVDEFPHELNEFQSRLHPEDMEYVMTQAKQHIEGKNDCFKVDFRFKKKDQNWLWIMGRGLIVERDENGLPTRFIGTHRDITERKQAEEKLKESENKYRDIFENSILGIILCEIIRNKEGKAIDFNHLEANDSASVNTGFQLEDIVGKKASELIGKKLQSEFTEKYEKVITTHRSVSYIKYFDVFKKTLQVTASYLYNDRFIINFIDISEQLQAEEKLKESEKKYRELFENSILGIYRSTPDGVYEEVNTAFSNILGYNSPEELILAVEDISKLYLNPKDREKIRDEFAKFGYVTNFVTQGRHQSGKIIWISINGKQHTRSNGEIYYEGTIQDITERKQAEEELQKSQEKFRVLYNSSPDMYVSVSSDDASIILCNDTLLKKTGYTKKEIIGSPIFKLYHDECLDEVKVLFKQFLETGIIQDKELLLKRKDGSKIDVSLNANAVKDKSGKILHSISSWRDITERKLAEEKILIEKEFYTSFVFSLKDWVWEMDMDGIHTFSNPAVESILGYKVDEVVGQHISKLWKEVDNTNNSKKIFSKTLVNSKGWTNSVGRFQHKNGSIVTTESSATPIYNSKNELVGFRGVDHDITERLKAEEEVLQSKKMLDATQQITKVGGWEFDVSSQKIFWTDETYRIHDFDPEKYPQGFQEHISKSLECYKPEDRDKIMKAFNDCVTKGIEYDLEVTFTSAKGKKKWVRTSAIPVYEKGKIVKVNGTLQDVTERKHAEEKEKEHHRDKVMISESAMKFVEFHKDEDIYSYIGEQLRDFIGEDSFVIVNSVDEEAHSSTIQAVLGMGKFSKKISKLLGRHPVGMTIDVEDLNIHYPDGKLHVYEEGLYGLLLNTVPKTICGSIEKLLKIKKIYVIDLAKREHFFGSIIILLKDGANGIKNKQVIETFIKQASIAVQKRQAEEKLTESEKRFKDLVDMLPETVIETDKNLNLTYVNQRGLEMSGYSKEDFAKGLNGLNILAPESHAEARTHFKMRMEGKDPGTIEYLASKKDGTQYPILFHANSIISNGEMTGIRGLIIDMSERKQAEDQIKYQANLLANVTDSILATDREFNIQFWNSAAEKQYGWTKKDVLGKHFSNFIQPQYPEDSRRTVIHSILQDGFWSGELFHKRQDGSLFPVLSTISQVKNTEGKVIGHISVNRDITERKRAEKIQKTLFNISNFLNTSDILSELFVKIREELGNVLDTTNFYIALYEEKTDMISLPYNADLQDVYETFPAGKTLTNYVIQTGEPLFADSQRINELTKQGKIELIGTPSLIWIGVPLKIENKVIGVIAVQSYDNPELYTTDDMGTLKFVSEEIALAIKHKQAGDQTKKDLQIKTALLQELYHRTKNNMQVISSMLKMQSRNIENLTISADKLTDFLYESFNVIINRIRSMSMVHQKLYQAQDLSHINLKEYIEDLTKSLISNYNIHSESISLKLELEDMFVLIDLAIPLGLILNEMISNVFKHAYSDKRKLELIIRLYKEKDDTMNIQVSDNGVGIPKDIDLNNVNSIGIQTIFNLIKYQLKGQIRYDTDNGMKWHIRLKDDTYKERV